MKWEIVLTDEERRNYDSATNVLVSWLWCRSTIGNPVHASWWFDGYRFTFWKQEDVLMFSLKFACASVTCYND